MKLISTFHDRLREAMGDMTATELAHTLGISKQSVSAYVNGTRKPKRIVAGEIARVLNVNPAWLIGYDVSRYPDVRKEHLGIGDGETRSPTPEDILDEFCRIYDLSDRDRSLLKEYLKLTPAERQVILNLMKTPSELD
jgi:transcriptional regulator with XRE-family HTH domain